MFVEVVTDGQGYSATRVEYQITRWLSLAVDDIDDRPIERQRSRQQGLLAPSLREAVAALGSHGREGSRMKNWNVRKTIVAREDMPEHHRLAQSLSWPHLVALGVGAIVGTGILTLIGVGAGKAGPAVILSFAIAGVICACAALAYAEVATMIPASGSAYTYSYVVFGELIAWMVGGRADPRIYSGRQRGRGRLVGLCRRLPQVARDGPARRLDQRARAGRHHQPAGDLHHLSSSPAC